MMYGSTASVVVDQLGFESLTRPICSVVCWLG